MTVLTSMNDLCDVIRLRRYITGGVVAWLYVSLLLGILSVAYAEEPVVENSVTVILNQSVQHFDPTFCASDQDKMFANHLFSGLMRVDEQGDIKPDLVAYYTLDDTKTRYTFKLKDSLWSDGHKITATDVAYSLKRALTATVSPKYRNLLRIIKNADALIAGKVDDANLLGVHIIDDQRLMIELEYPAPYFLSILAHCVSFPVPQHHLQDKDWMLKQPITSGAFQLIKHNDRQIILDRNLKYYAFDQIQVNRIIFLFQNDFQESLALFRKEQVDIIESPPPYLRSWLEKEYGDYLMIGNDFASYYYVLNLKDKFLSKKIIRQALSMVIDRQLLAAATTQLYMLPTERFVPPTQPLALNYAGNEVVDNIVEKAQALMLAEGFSQEHPFKLTLQYNVDPAHLWVAKMIAGMWQRIYVEVTLEALPLQEHMKKLEEGKFAVARTAWRGDFLDQHNFLFLFDGNNKTLNYGHFNHEEFNVLLRQANETFDEHTRQQLLTQAEEILLSENAIIPLFHYARARLVSKRLQGVVPNQRLNARFWTFRLP